MGIFFFLITQETVRDFCLFYQPQRHAMNLFSMDDEHSSRRMFPCFSRPVFI